MMDDGSTAGTVGGDGAGHAIIRFERRLPYAPGDVWSALTEPDRLRQWWGEVEVAPQLGGRFDVTWLNPTPDGGRLTMHSTISVFEPPRVLETRGDVHGVLRWELRPDGAGTLVVFTSTLDLPDEFRTRTLAGWQYHLLALDHTLGRGTVDLVGLPEWPGIHERYIARDG
jgi:uncharacterized protein YndB with AHSA1/START domain